MQQQLIYLELKTPGFTLLTEAEILEHHQFTLKLTFHQENYFEFYPAGIQMSQKMGKCIDF